MSVKRVKMWSHFKAIDVDSCLKKKEKKKDRMWTEGSSRSLGLQQVPPVHFDIHGFRKNMS